MVTLRDKNNSRKRIKLIAVLLIVFPLVFNVFNVTVSAAGMTETHEDNGLDYTKYDDSRYCLDYYDDGSWFDFDPVINSLCNGLFILSRSISSFTGSAIREAYKLDFVKDCSDKIGKNIQAIAGVDSTSGIGSGLFSGFLLIIVLGVGLYVLYQGIFKRATSRAVGAIFNFLCVFLCGVFFVAYAPTFISYVADFSSEVNTGVLSASSKVFFPEAENSDVDETEYIINNLWNVQVRQPWLVLQFNDTGVTDERAKAFLDYAENSDERKEAARKEVEENNNETMNNVGAKLGNTLLILIVNLVISIFVLLLCGMLIVSQFLFLVFISFMPFLFVFSMFPSMSGKLLKASLTLFNLLLTKTAISVVMTVAFSLSSLFLTLTSDTYYLFVAFLQVVCFVSIYKTMGKLLSFLGLDINDVGRPVNMVSRKAYQQGRKMLRHANQGRKKVQHAVSRLKQSTSDRRDKRKRYVSQNSESDTASNVSLSDSSTYSNLLGSSQNNSYSNTDSSINSNVANRTKKRTDNNRQEGNDRQDLYSNKSQSNVDYNAPAVNNRKVRQQKNIDSSEYIPDNGSYSNKQENKNNKPNVDNHKQTYSMVNKNKPDHNALSNRRPDIERRRQALEQNKVRATSVDVPLTNATTQNNNRFVDTHHYDKPTIDSNIILNGQPISRTDVAKRLEKQGKYRSEKASRITEKKTRKFRTKRKEMYKE